MKLRFLLWFAGNSLPRFRGVDTAIKRRATIFQCYTPVDKVIVGFDRNIFEDGGPAILGKTYKIPPELHQD